MLAFEINWGMLALADGAGREWDPLGGEREHGTPETS